MDKKTFDKIDDKDRASRVLEGTLYWTYLNKPKHSEKYKSNAFTTTMGLDAANVKLAESYGLKVKEANKGTPEPHVELKRSIRPGKTEAESRPQIVDAVQGDVPYTLAIGNGSKAACKFATYWYDNNGGGIGAALLKVQILDLVPYAASDASMTSHADGFKMSDVATTAEVVDDGKPPFDIDGFDDDDGFEASQAS